jgi:drug/metabolite transporter (DMT)-like permease
VKTQPGQTTQNTTAGAVGPKRSAVPLLLLFLGVAGCWGMNSVAMRVAGRSVPPLSVATVRALLGGLLLLVIARIRRADWPRGRAEWVGLAWIAFFMTGLSTASLFLAAKNAPAGINSIFTNTMPLFTALLAPMLLNERVTRRVAMGLGVGLTGTVIVAWRAIHGQVRLIGIVFGVVGAITAAMGSIMYKRHPLPRLNRLMAVAVQLLMSSLVLGIAAIPDDRSHMRFPWQFGLSFVYLTVIGLALSFVMFSALLSRATSMQSSAVAYLATVFGVVFGALLLRERLSWTVLVGGVIAILGVAIVQTAQLGGTRRRSRSVAVQIQEER